MAEMELEIENEKENKLFNRRELTVRLYHEGISTPDRKTVRNRVADLTGFAKGKVIIQSIKSTYGKDESVVEVKLYENKEDAYEYESKHILERNGLTGGEKSE